ncbi:MAG: hypothetical protein QF570_15845 [Myxococcota bacterium]|jgi:glucuronokinase|nr:hypothetical protein [Myxococcota bacterium]
MNEAVDALVHARVGLLGNPSDAYGGKAIAFTLGNFAAQVRIEAAAGYGIASPDGVSASWSSFGEMAGAISPRDRRDGERLIRAALRQFARRFFEAHPKAADAIPGMRIHYETTIPREVGLSGSSAIVIACLRALLSWFGRSLSNDEVAELALSAEVDELGIAAGPMDRLIQAHEGCLWMDFAAVPRGGKAVHRQLPLKRLPETFVAWDPHGGEASGVVHSDVRARYERGDEAVRSAMATFPKLVDAGMAQLEAGDHEGFAALVDRNFDTRASIWNLTERDIELVAIGRRCGCAVKQTGSGGAVVGVMKHGIGFESVEREYASAGYRVVRPTFVAPGGDES